MRKSAAFLPLVVLLSSPGLSAQQITMEGVARSVSNIDAIINICPKHLAINLEEARKYRLAFFDIGLNTYGRQRFGAAVARELKRRYAEVSITGEAQWCTYQRAHWQSLGTNKIFQMNEGPAERKNTVSYLGCFRDGGSIWGKEGRDLDGARWDESAMTNLRCINFCRSQSFAYAATQYSTACFCGNRYGSKGRADNCNMPCGGKSSEMCGGQWANSVWRLGTNHVRAPPTATPAIGGVAAAAAVGPKARAVAEAKISAPDR
jgi:WSC domain